MLFDNEMTNLLMFVCIGLLAGLIVGELRQGEGYGLLGNAIIGFLGGSLGWILI